SGDGVYLARNVAAETEDQLATADTSRILSYAAGVFTDFTGPIYAPSALHVDPYGRFGSRLYAAAADSFESWSGAPIRGRGVLTAVDNGGAILPFVQNLDSPVGLAFAPNQIWDGNLY